MLSERLGSLKGKLETQKEFKNGTYTSIYSHYSESGKMLFGGRTQRAQL